MALCSAFARILQLRNRCLRPGRAQPRPPPQPVLRAWEGHNRGCRAVRPQEQPLLRVLWDDLDFEYGRPQFASDKQALFLRVVGDAVQNRFRPKAIHRTENAGEVNPPHYLASLRRDASDPISVPEIGRAHV